MDNSSLPYTTCRPHPQERAPRAARAALSAKSYTTSPLAGKPLLSARRIACQAGMGAPFGIKDLIGDSATLRDPLAELKRRHHQPFEQGAPTRWADVTSRTGRQVEGPFSHWVTEDNGATRENLAGPGPDGELLVFRWTLKDDWQVEDISQRTGRRIQGPVASWQIRPAGDTDIERLGGLSPEGDVLVFTRRPGERWSVEDVTADTGPRLATPLTSWVLATGVEQLIGATADGVLHILWRSPNQDWDSRNLTDKTGVSITAQVTAWLTKEQGQAVQHLAGPNPNGDLIEFRWSPRQDWTTINVSQATGRQIAGPAMAWLVGDVEHLAGAGPDGELLVFWRSGGGDWQFVDVTDITGVSVQGRPSVYQVEDGDTTVELLSVRDSQGHLLLHWWTPSWDWQALDLSEIIGREIQGNPQAWLTNDAEHLAVVAKDGHLLILRGLSRERLLTDALHRPWKSYRRKRHVRAKLLTLLIDPGDPNLPAQARSHVEDLLFGASESMRDYFREVSGGYFTVDNVAVLGTRDSGSTATPGWYDIDHPRDEYEPEERDIGSEAARNAAAKFDFKAFDHNGDGHLTPDELGILIVKPGAGFGGGLNRRLGKDFTPRNEAKGIEVDGVMLDSPVAEVSIGDWQGIVSHELAHLFLNLADMYLSFDYPTPAAANDYSLMDDHFRGPHLDAFSKLKLGWLRPKIVFRTDRYTLPDVETRRVVWVLLDPRHGVGEYFLVENRWGGNTYDQHMPDQGLAVWHIMEDPCLYRWVEAPPNIPPDDWGRAALRGIRRAVRMIRPFQGSDDDSRALWDGSDPQTGYDLLSEDSNPDHAELRWADGSPSGFALRDISASGPEMQVTVETPG